MLDVLRLLPVLKPLSTLSTGSSSIWAEDRMADSDDRLLQSPWAWRLSTSSLTIYFCHDHDKPAAQSLLVLLCPILVFHD
jgi:hypothetical protein